LSRSVTSQLAGAVLAVTKPLEFAAHDDFAHVDRLVDLEAGVVKACRRVLEMPAPRALKVALAEVEALFGEVPTAGGEDASDESSEAPTSEESGSASALRADKIRRALAVLEPFRGEDWPDALLASPLSVFAGIGPRRAESLSKRGLATVEQLLFYLPSDYDDRRALVAVGDLEVGQRATFLSEVQSTGSSMARRRGGRLGKVLEAVVGDDTGSISLKWFHVPDGLAGGLVKGARILVTGDVRRHRFAKQIVHPELEVLSSGEARKGGARADPDAARDSAPATDEHDEANERLEGLRRLVPAYSAPEGVPGRTLRGLVERAVSEYADLVTGHLPSTLVRDRELPPASKALRLVHAPPYDADLTAYRGFASPAHQRLVLEELYLLELGLALRHGEGAKLVGVPLSVDAPRVQSAPTCLPFSLTGAQRRAWDQIRGDLGRRRPMNRLLQGDVGSGKTVVALLAALAAAASGKQAALMAPTELLAEQHARTLERLVTASSEAFGLRVVLLTASLPRPVALEARRAIAEGSADLAVGTHALLQKDVVFHDLALAIIDEQHRFGVLQRQALASKLGGGRHPHTLVMTATPIPRTLAMTLYGDLDTAVIDELPPGRRAIETLLVREGEGGAVATLVGETIARGEQVYVVYPLVDESEKIDLRSAMESRERIARAFPEARVDLVHGRLEADERRAAMQRFERGETNILVATTVIEVGVDVPNATLMVIEHAERFGLAQLHQLRGRVGRGELPGTCVLVSRARRKPGSKASGSDADTADRGEARLKAMLETTDGFEIANADLRIRGPGEFLGTRQSGHLPELRIADLLRDQRLLIAAREAAFETVRRDPGLRRAPELRAAVEARWGERLALVGVG
jgi:ATP-dependent DNA helicase RecG